ncbi:MAG: superoxide dismutase, partial [Ferruginibacter sp.]
MDNQYKRSRRKFITDSAKSTAALSLGLAGFNELFTSCNTLKKVISPGSATTFTQQPLPYSYDALENIIDRLTMEIHYSKHAASYAKNLNEAAIAEGVDTKQPLEDVLAKISRYSVKMRNNAGGHYNHELFWKCMRPKTSGNKPAGKLLDAIEKTFSSFSKFQSAFGE